MSTEDTDDNSNIQEEFCAKTPNNNFKVDCWHPDKNGNITPRDIEKNHINIFGLNVMYVLNILKKLFIILHLKINGVVIVVEKNYVMMMIVIFVIIIHLPV